MENEKMREEKDRELLQNLDRIIAGDSDISGEMDEDDRAALDFARKMASLGETPTGVFSDKLKAELVHQLAEQEKKEYSAKQPLFFWEIPRRTIWQGTIAALILVIIIAIILLITLLINHSG